MRAALSTLSVPIRARPRLGAVLLLVVCAVAPPAAQDPPSEYGLKAAFLYQFPQFVDWPDDAWVDARRVEICVVAPNPFGRELERLISGESLHGRPLAVRVVEPGGAVASCHLMFVSARSSAAALAMLKDVASRPVLTVGEDPAFLQHGGMILLKIADRRVRFEVDLNNVRRARLRISSQLLALAQSVRGGLP